MRFFNKAKMLEGQVNKHYETAKDVADIINKKLPEDKKIGVPQLDEKSTVKENTSKLVTFIQTIQDFVEDLDDSLKENLSAENYAKVAKVTATLEQILPIVKTITKGIVAVVGPVVASIAKKLKNSKALKSLERKLGIVHATAVVHAIHDSHKKKGQIDEDHPGIKENEHELDHAIKSLDEAEDRGGPDLHTMVKAMVAWHRTSQ